MLQQETQKATSVNQPVQTVKTKPVTVTQNTQQVKENKVVLPQSIQKIVNNETTPQKQVVKEEVQTQQELILWNKWRSNIQNSIMKDVKLPIIQEGTIFKFSFDVDDLTPGASYLYKIQALNTYSDVYSFSTPDKSGYFNFIWSSDNHTNTQTVNPERYQYMQKLVGLADKAIDNCLIIQSGDNVITGGRYESWRVNESTGIFKNHVFASIMGNHETNKLEGGYCTEDWDKHYRTMFNNPTNNPNTNVGNPNNNLNVNNENDNENISSSFFNDFSMNNNCSFLNNNENIENIDSKDIINNINDEIKKNGKVPYHYRN